MTLLPDECGGAVVQRRGTRTWVVLDLRGSPVEQRCRLAHELVHIDRGSWRCRFAPATWNDKIAREERRVDEDVADWLVPGQELLEVVTALVAEGSEVTTKVIAAEFQVTRPIARIALDRLDRGRRLGTVA